MNFYFGSTYSDLKKHRVAALSAVQDYAKRSKENYVDYNVFDPNSIAETDESHLDICLRNLEEAHYFVLILGWRYGYIPEGSDKSIIELEYETAIEHSMTRFCFLIDDRHPVSPKFIETGAGAEKLKRFKSRVQEEHYVSRFTTPEDLARQLTLALSTLDKPMGAALQALIEHPALTLEYRRFREEANVLRETVEFYKKKLDRVVPADPIWRGREFEIDNTLCFVLMPFADKFFLQYEEAIIPALEAAGLRGVHAGEIFGTREIMEDIWESICSAKLIIADVTGRNPNVFYELGIAHTIGKPCVVLTQSPNDVPFDISARRYIQYDHAKPVQLRTKLEKTIKAILL